jgi:hypothetical protein
MTLPLNHVILAAASFRERKSILLLVDRDFFLVV